MTILALYGAHTCGNSDILISCMHVHIRTPHHPALEHITRDHVLRTEIEPKNTYITAYLISPGINYLLLTIV